MYVPYGSKTQYQSAAQWNGISKIIEATTAVSNPSAVKFNAYVVNGQVQISNVEIGKPIDVYTLGVSLISRSIATNETISTNLPSKGIYIVRDGNQSLKVINN